MLIKTLKEREWFNVFIILSGTRIYLFAEACVFKGIVLSIGDLD